MAEMIYSCLLSSLFSPLFKNIIYILCIEEVLGSIMATRKIWADGPFKLLTTPRAGLKVRLFHLLMSIIEILSCYQGAPESKASRNASEMALVHNVVFRGLNSIYLQAPNVKDPQDIADFMTFSRCWSSVLHSHHSTEETVYFPLLNEQSKEKVVMANNHAEHEAFLSGLIAFDEYLAEVTADTKPFDASKLIKLIDGFGPALERHLNHEIEVLVELEKDTGIDWELMGKTMAAHSKKTADRVSKS